MPAITHRDIGHMVAPKAMYFVSAFEDARHEQELARKEDGPDADRLEPVVRALAIAVVLSAIEDSRELEGISPDRIGEARRVAASMAGSEIVAAATIAISALSGSEPMSFWSWDDPAIRRAPDVPPALYPGDENAVDYARYRLGEWVGNLADNQLIYWPAHPRIDQFSAGFLGD